MFTEEKTSVFLQVLQSSQRLPLQEHEAVAPPGPIGQVFRGKSSLAAPLALKTYSFWSLEALMSTALAWLLFGRCRDIFAEISKDHLNSKQCSFGFTPRPSVVVSYVIIMPLPGPLHPAPHRLSREQVKQLHLHGQASPDAYCTGDFDPVMPGAGATVHTGI